MWGGAVNAPVRGDAVAGQAEPTPEVVYPARFRQLLLPVGVLATFFGFVTFEGLAHFRSPFSSFLALLLWAAGVFLLSLLFYVSFHILRLVVKPQALLRLDGDGLECAVGRIFWRDVERISVARYKKESGEGGTYFEDWLWLIFRPGTEPVPPVSSYFDGRLTRRFGARRMVPRRVPTGLEVPPWTRMKRVVATFCRFYSGPIGNVELRGKRPGENAT